MKNAYEVIIIGGGPAGLAAAEELAKNKKSVLLLEKNKEIGPKVCAGGLTTKIADFGISLKKADKKFSLIKVHSAKKTYAISLPWIFLASIDRKKLGQFLLQKALASGTEVKTNILVKEVLPDGIIIDGKKIKYKYLIGADGSLSIIRQYLGLKTKKVGVTLQYLVPREYKNLELFFDVDTFGSGFGWIYPHRGYTLVGFGQDRKEIKGRNLINILNQWCQKIKIDITDAKEKSWSINFDYRGWHFKNIFLVGDAGGFASGLTGEGIYNALVSGKEAAKKIIDPNYTCPKIKCILKKKHNQEKLLSFMQINKKLLSVYYKILFFSIRSQWMTKKLLNFFS